MEKKPLIATELPGPRARDLLERNKKYRYPQGPFTLEFVAEKAEGAFIEDVDGNRFLDFMGGIAVLSTGSCHPRVVKAVQDQLGRFLHVGPLLFFDAEVRLAEKITALAPGETPMRVFLGNSGTESIEAALKVARYKTKRGAIISFTGSFHGRTLGAMSVSASKVTHRKHMGPLLPEVYFAHFPYCYRCPFHLAREECGLYCLAYIREVLFQKVISPEDVAAIIVEPIQGEGGYIVPPPEFLPALRELTREFGILLIADEIQTGAGRTGRFFAVEHWEVEPDIICLAKGIASGLPIGIMLAREDVLAWEPGAHGTTFGGNPLSCVASLETIDLLTGGLIDSAAQVGRWILDRLREMQEHYEIIGDVRGKGLMIGIEIVKDKKTKTVDPDRRKEIIKKAYQKGLILLECGASAIRICPPLVLSREEADLGLSILRESIEAASVSQS
ncbi:MAG: acetyl ornithine aminotransferase family protein [Deltaproteobacteria bacterium]|nr:acetyl ornithine aminotransferase family protein [Deltaproteobacteria bacterium]